MTKAAVETTTSDKTARKAKRLFFTNLFDLSWKLASTILTPTVLGAWLDNKNDSGNLFAIFGLLIGVALAALIIRATVLKVMKETDN